jgi:hypothetical protein
MISGAILLKTEVFARTASPAYALQKNGEVMKIEDVKIEDAADANYVIRKYFNNQLYAICPKMYLIIY